MAMAKHDPDLETKAQHGREVAAQPDATASHQQHFSALARFYESLAEGGPAPESPILPSSLEEHEPPAPRGPAAGSRPE
jgi:hypothetical protein